jgi:hypothetical protein
MIRLLRIFVKHCDDLELTPDERHIDSFLENLNLENLNLEHLRTHFIYFCFYNWEKRHLKLDLLKELNIIK